MNSTLSRLDFEKWFMSSNPDADLEFDSRGEYYDLGAFQQWPVWEASRKNLHIKLPEIPTRQLTDREASESAGGRLMYGRFIKAMTEAGLVGSK